MNPTKGTRKMRPEKSQIDKNPNISAATCHFHILTRTTSRDEDRQAGCKKRRGWIHSLVTKKKLLGILAAMKGNATSAASFVNRFLSAITVFFLGIFGGFSIFHYALQYRLEQTQYERNETLEIFKNNYLESEKERKQCVETDGGRLQEINDLRGRLDAQYTSWRDLSAAQRSLLLRDRESSEQLQQIHEDYERDQKNLVSLRAELNEKDRELSGVQEKLVAVQRDLQMQRKSQTSLESDVTRLQEAGITTSDMMIKHVQQRDGMICRQLYVHSFSNTFRFIDETTCHLIFILTKYFYSISQVWKGPILRQVRGQTSPFGI